MPDKEVQGMLKWEQVQGIVGCFSCEYKGKMLGYINPESRGKIYFVCPECQAIEPVKNPE